MTLKTDIVRIREQEKQTPLSKGQKRFNQLIQQITQKRKVLMDWQALILVYQKQYHESFMPRLQTWRQLHKELVYALDAAYARQSSTIKEKKQIRGILCALIEGLVSEGEDEELKALYHKHSGLDLEETIAEEKEMMKDFMEGLFDIELDEEMDWGSEAEVIRSIGEKVFANQEKAKVIHEKSSRKKSAKMLEKEKKEQKIARHMRQSLQEIYRKLASALHPDKEFDPAEQTRKAELMQRVNVAYGKKDLLQLLELQLEIEQMDQEAMNALSEDRLQHYNRVLSEQLSRLKDEVMRMEFAFRIQFDLPPDPFLSSSPKQELAQLQQNIREIQKDISQLEKDLLLLQETENLKIWLKKNRVKNNFPEVFFGC